MTFYEGELVWLVGILHYRMIVGDKRHFKQYTFQLYHTGPLLLVQEPENNHHINMVKVANKQYNINTRFKNSLNRTLYRTF
jgi:hypothetical protein